MASPATSRKAKEDPSDRLTPAERSRYQEAADLIQSWLAEDPSYDREEGRMNKGGFSRLGVLVLAGRGQGPRSVRPRRVPPFGSSGVALRTPLSLLTKSTGSKTIAVVPSRQVRFKWGTT